MTGRSKKLPRWVFFTKREPGWDLKRYERIWHEEEIVVPWDFKGDDLNRLWKKKEMWRDFWALDDEGKPSDTAKLCRNAPAHFVNEPLLAFYDQATETKVYNDPKELKLQAELEAKRRAERDALGKYFEYTVMESKVNYTFFRKNFSTILLGIIELSKKPRSPIKSSVRKFLSKWETTEKLSEFILSLIPSHIQSVLNLPGWTFEQLWRGNEDTWETILGGIYLLIAGSLPGRHKVRTVAYVGAGTGRRGLFGRISQHLNARYRAQHQEKLLYQYVDGQKDGHERNIQPLALAFFNDPAECDKDDFEALHDLVEEIFIVYFGLFDMDGDDTHKIKELAALRPAEAQGSQEIIPMNRGNPIGIFHPYKEKKQRKENLRPAAIFDESESESSCEDRYGNMGPTMRFADAQSRCDNLVVHRTVKQEKDDAPVGLYVAFHRKLQITLPLIFMRLFRVKEGDILKFTWSLCPAGEKHPKRWIQDTLPSDDSEASTVYRLGIQVSGTDSKTRKPWSFWLVRAPIGCDWSHLRRTSNHLGSATAMTMIEWVFYRYQEIPVPLTRVSMKENDRCLYDGRQFPSLIGTKAYSDSFEYSSNHKGDCWVWRNNEKVRIDTQLKKVCVCDLLHIYKDCDAHDHDNLPVEGDCQ